MGEDTEDCRWAAMPTKPDLVSGSALSVALMAPREGLSAPAVVGPGVGILQYLALIDAAQSLVEAVSVSRRLFGSFFPRTAFVLGWRREEGPGFSAIGGDGVPLEAGALSPRVLSAFLGTRRVRRPLRLKGPLRRLFEGSGALSVTSFPFVSCGELWGFACLFDCELETDDLLVVELITCRMAARLLALGLERERAEQGELSSRLAELSCSLERSESREELYGKILDGAADLSGACQGSVMLMGRDGRHLQVVRARGAGSEVVRNLAVALGTGIAGGVAQRGGALLVRDVESDPRTARRNRPRFQSKSLLSLPFKLNNKVLGVLNLSDKADSTNFNAADLTLLTTYCAFASLLIERSQVREEICQLEQLTCTDPLTGTYNRRFLSQRLEEELNRSQHQGLEFTLLFLDLDHFKGYNDRFGHLAGDEALVAIAKLVQGTLRDMDTLARFGGEEFCVILPGTSKRQGKLVAERIRQEVAREIFPGAQGPGVGRLTASLGVATFPEDGATAVSLLKA